MNHCPEPMGGTARLQIGPSVSKSNSPRLKAQAARPYQRGAFQMSDNATTRPLRVSAVWTRIVVLSK